MIPRDFILRKLPGIYQSDSIDFIGKIGKEYILEIKLPDGSLYKSDPEKLLPCLQFKTWIIT